MPGKIVATSRSRYRASAAERRMYGGATVTEFFVYRAEDRNDASKWKIVRGYGKTPGERKTDAIRRSGLLTEGDPEGRTRRRRRIGPRSPEAALDRALSHREQANPEGGEGRCVRRFWQPPRTSNTDGRGTALPRRPRRFQASPTDGWL